jgi:hypothetical protein
MGHALGRSGSVFAGRRVVMTARHVHRSERLNKAADPSARVSTPFTPSKRNTFRRVVLSSGISDMVTTRSSLRWSDLAYDQ